MWNRVRSLFRLLNIFSPATVRAEVETLLGDIHYQQIGIFIVSWARMEMSLDFTNWIILNLVSGGDQLAPALPRSLDQKIALFQTAHEQLPDMAEFRADADALVVRIHNLKEHRHDLVHGRGRSILEGRSRAYVRLHLKGNDIRQLTKTYSMHKLLKLDDDANELMGNVALHLGRLRDRFMPQKDSD